MEDTAAPGKPAPRAWSPVLVIGLALIALQLGLRVWAQWNSWFFTDDYRLLIEATGRSLSMSYLLQPFDSQFMPLGRFIAWAVATSSPLDWGLAAAIVIVVQLAASMACLWMLVVMFGTRLAVLPLLAFYLFSALPVPGFMWWAAALNQLPMQLVFFLALGFWVKYLRSRQLRLLVTTTLLIAVGLLAYVKVLLVVGVMGYLAFAYFAQGSVARRFAQLWRDFRSAFIIGGLLTAGYLVAYTTGVPQPFEESKSSQLLAVADTMLGISLPTGLLGGPWSWWDTSPPIVLVDPPNVTVHIAWVALSGLLAYSMLRRRHAGRAWVLLGGYSVAVYALLATSRGQIFGSLAGLELRYLTDVVAVWVLVLGLAFLELPGAVESSRPRREPLLTVAVGKAVIAVGIALVTLGGLYSTIQYVGFWHRDNASALYTANLTRTLSETPLADVVDGHVPETVMPAYTAPYNRLSEFVVLTGHEVRFPALSHQLHVVQSDGRLTRAHVRPVIASGSGPIEGCGWRIDRAATRVPFSSVAFPWGWWMRVAYLSSDDGEVEIQFGRHRVQAQVLRGLNDLYVSVPEPVDGIELRSLDSGLAICVDVIEVGPVEPATEGAP